MQHFDGARLSPNSVRNAVWHALNEPVCQDLRKRNPRCSTVYIYKSLGPLARDSPSIYIYIIYNIYTQFYLKYLLLLTERNKISIRRSLHAVAFRSLNNSGRPFTETVITKLTFSLGNSYAKASKQMEIFRKDFDVLLTVRLTIFFSVINQIDAQNVCFTISLFNASTCFEHMCSPSGGQNCITPLLVSSELQAP